jgi:hypothetical protein
MTDNDMHHDDMTDDKAGCDVKKDQKTRLEQLEGDIQLDRLLSAVALAAALQVAYSKCRFRSTRYAHVCDKCQLCGPLQDTIAQGTYMPTLIGASCDGRTVK